tara:strand:- start:2299 stop:2814 length:516 start_codon:yes stop_codon:yes gene_type:complete
MPWEIGCEYVKKMDSMIKGGVGLLLWGPNGRGKTALAVGIGKEFRRRGCTVLFVECAAVKDIFISRAAFDEEEVMWNRAKRVDVLILDDLGKGVQDSKGFGARVIDQLIRHRTSNQRVTFITTNIDPPRLAGELKISTMHSLKESIVPVKIVGPDRREACKSKLLQALGVR